MPSPAGTPGRRHTVLAARCPPPGACHLLTRRTRALHLTAHLPPALSQVPGRHVPLGHPTAATSRAAASTPTVGRSGGPGAEAIVATVDGKPQTHWSPEPALSKWPRAAGYTGETAGWGESLVPMPGRGSAGCQAQFWALRPSDKPPSNLTGQQCRGWPPSLPGHHTEHSALGGQELRTLTGDAGCGLRARPASMWTPPGTQQGARRKPL